MRIVKVNFLVLYQVHTLTDVENVSPSVLTPEVKGVIVVVLIDLCFLKSLSEFMEDVIFSVRESSVLIVFKASFWQLFSDFFKLLLYWTGVFSIMLTDF